jgi:PAS domain S-box-containing protein/putative nucleotidyltransferase with HDIG domain
VFENPLKVLFLEDNPLDVELAMVALRQAGIEFRYTTVDTRQAFLDGLNDSLDIILADYTLPQYNAIEALRDLKERSLDIPVVIVTGTISEEVAVECIKQGAADYLLKDRLARLGSAINQVLEEKRLRQEKARAEQELIASEERYRFLADFSPDGIILYFGDIISYINQAGVGIIGASNQEEVIGLTADFFVQPDERKRLDNRNALLYEGKSVESEIFTIKRLDGKLIPIEIKTSPIDLHNEEGKPAFLTVFRDVTDRIQRQKELEAIAAISESLREATVLPEMVPVTLDEIMTMLDLTGVGIILFDTDTGENAFTAGRGVWENVNINSEPLGDGVIRHVYRTGQTYVQSEVKPEDGFPEPHRKHLAAAVKDFAILSLVTQEGSIGILAVGKDTEITENDVRILKAIGDITGSAFQRAILEEELESNFVETVLALANALEVRHTQTSDHSQKLAVWAQETLKRMGGSTNDLQNVRLAALLHDIGKIGMPDDILQKAGELTEKEWGVVKKHPEIGAEIVAPIQKLAEVAPIIRAHQEKFDGSGYPLGLKGIEIPLPARVVTVVDAFCAMTEDRVYRPARSVEKAINELEACSGKDFDPQVVRAFIQVLEEMGEK